MEHLNLRQQTINAVNDYSALVAIKSVYCLFYSQEEYFNSKNSFNSYFPFRRYFD